MVSHQILSGHCNLLVLLPSLCFCQGEWVRNELFFFNWWEGGVVLDNDCM